MFKIFGAMIIIAASVGLGRILGNNLKRRIDNISSLTDFIDYISSQVMLFKTPLDEIYATFSSDYLIIKDFITCLQNKDNSIYDSALSCGLLCGEEEKDIMRSFSDTVRTSSVDELVKLCSLTSDRMRKLEERLYNELPDKKRVYNTISILAGTSTVILLI